MSTGSPSARFTGSRASDDSQVPRSSPAPPRCSSAPHSRWAGESTHDRACFTEAAYRAHIERLSSDEFEGRAPGTEGEKKTLAYIEQQFRAAGLEPGIGDSFLQAVPVVEIATHPDERCRFAAPRAAPPCAMVTTWSSGRGSRWPSRASRTPSSSSPATASSRPSTAGTITPGSTCAARSRRARQRPGLRDAGPQAVHRQRDDLLRSLDLQVRGSRAPGRSGPVRRPRNQAGRIPVGSRPQRLHLADRPAHRRLRLAAPRARGLDDAGGRAACARAGRRGLPAAQAGRGGPQVPSAAARGPGERRRAQRREILDDLQRRGRGAGQRATRRGTFSTPPTGTTSARPRVPTTATSTRSSTARRTTPPASPL
jgi:hypothetical protein